MSRFHDEILVECPAISSRAAYVLLVKKILFEIFPPFDYKKNRFKWLALRKKIIRAYRAQISKEFICAYCQKPIKIGSGLSIDHILPVSKGGRTTLKNLTFSCQKCNEDKADKIIEAPYNLSCLVLSDEIMEYFGLYEDGILMGGMMTRKKQVIRGQFREICFKRDDYRCVICGFQSSQELAEKELNCHHITNRNHMPNGGYVKENGATLCDKGVDGCHYKAETGEISAETLYKIINSSLELAIEKSNE